jgi:hypothetical protein
VCDYSTMAPKYADLHDLAEDERIKAIGESAMTGLTVGVCLEKNEPAKVARYIRKVTTRYPQIGVLEQCDGPVANVVTVKFGRKPH